VFGAVLIARISMQAEIADRAALYGVILGLAVWFALQKYVEYPPGSGMASWGWAVNAGLIALIWWSAHRLTWDCTLIDETADSSGVGLLEQAGLESGIRGQGSGVRNQGTEVKGQKSGGRESEADERAEAAAGPAEPGERKGKRKEPGGLWGWWRRYRQYR